MASLYKIECILNSKSPNADECHEVLKNVEDIISKYSIKDKKIDAAVKSKVTAVKKLTSLNEESKDRISESNQEPRKQIIRKSAEPISRTATHSQRKKSPGFQIKVRDQSPIFRFRRPDSDSDHGSLFTKRSKKPGFSEYMNRQIKKKGKDLGSEISSMKSELRNEITYLAQIGDILKKEVNQIQKEKPRIRISSKAGHGNNTEDGGLESYKEEDLQSEIRKKLDVILQSQQEWERQRLLLNEKLERLERNMEQNKGEDSTSNGKKASQISSINSPVSHLKVISSSKAPLNAQQQESGHSTPNSLQASSNIHKHLELGFMDLLSGKPKEGDATMSEPELFKRSLTYCIETLLKIEAALPPVTLRHTITQKNVEYEVECLISGGKGRPMQGVRLRLFLKSARCQGSPLHEQLHSFEQIQNIMLGLEFQAVMPLFTPVAAFDRLEYFLNFVFFKFLSVD